MKSLINLFAFALTSLLIIPVLSLLYSSTKGSMTENQTDGNIDMTTVKLYPWESWGESSSESRVW